MAPRLAQLPKPRRHTVRFQSANAPAFAEAISDELISGSPPLRTNAICSSAVSIYFPRIVEQGPQVPTLKPSLAHLEDHDLVRRAYAAAIVPGFLTLVSSACIVILPWTTGRVIADLAAAIPLNTAGKMVTDTALLLTGVAFVTAAMNMGRLFRWGACTLGGVSFDALAGCLGTSICILPAASWAFGGRGTGLSLYLVALCLTGMGTMRVTASILYGLDAPEILKLRSLRLFLGAVFVISALAAFVDDFYRH
jgi:hypothetical protein